MVADTSTRRIAVAVDGSDVELEELSIAPNPALAALARVRLGATRPPTAATDPIALGWAVAEPMAGRGDVTLTPSGSLIARLVEGWMRSAARDTLCGFEMRSPLMHRWGSAGGELADLAGTFDERILRTTDGGGEDLMIRYSADPGLLGYLRGSMVPCSETPQRLFEIGVAMRRNRPGERNVSAAAIP